MGEVSDWLGYASPFHSYGQASYAITHHSSCLPHLLHSCIVGHASYTMSHVSMLGPLWGFPEKTSTCHFKIYLLSSIHFRRRLSCTLHCLPSLYSHGLRLFRSRNTLSRELYGKIHQSRSPRCSLRLKDLHLPCHKWTRVPLHLYLWLMCHSPQKSFWDRHPLRHLCPS